MFLSLLVVVCNYYKILVEFSTLVVCRLLSCCFRYNLIGFVFFLIASLAYFFSEAFVANVRD